MKAIIAPIDKRLLQMELKRAAFLKPTNRGGNEIYIVDERLCPNIMQEIGRLREITFRLAGGGTGNAVDIDAFDTGENPYQQLVVWDAKECEFLGGYRYIISPQSVEDLATSELFNFSPKFVADYMPYMIELGRSFVCPKYQNIRRNIKSIYALDNLWDGIGGLICAFPELRYCFGKVTMYPSYNKEARNILHYFLQKYFPDHDGLVTPIVPLKLEMDVPQIEPLFVGNSYEKDHKILVRELKERGESMPPLINSYMGLSPTMKTFGCAINHEFGGVEETGILITLDELYPAKKERYITVHRPNKLNLRTLRNLLRKPKRKKKTNANTTITT
jgi:hypothetical protein